MTAAKPRGATGVQIGEAQARGMVMQGAAMVFYQKGARAASVEDILAAARISRRTFYRLYESKDDVLLALYKVGTERLVDECARVARERTDPIHVVEGFIDAHLRNATQLGRMVFVLGGEASRQESILHPARMEAHARLVEILTAKTPPHDPWLTRGLLLALEGVTRMMLEACDEGRKVTPAAVARVRRVMLRMATASIAGEGPQVAPVPLPPEQP
ncbi:MAG: TetR/AcrR family transcriptional regulator [Deltaproteobacteria bacterium]|nr:TetR/AcrR family transcriptional regulator [Kofleriaceae bacterium]